MGRRPELTGGGLKRSVGGWEGINPTTILVATGKQRPIFSSGATDRSGDSGTESTPQDQWPFLCRILSLATPSPVAI